MNVVYKSNDPNFKQLDWFIYRVNCVVYSTDCIAIYIHNRAFAKALYNEQVMQHRERLQPICFYDNTSDAFDMRHKQQTSFTYLLTRQLQIEMMNILEEQIKILKEKNV